MLNNFIVLFSPALQLFHGAHVLFKRKELKGDLNKLPNLLQRTKSKCRQLESSENDASKGQKI